MSRFHGARQRGAASPDRPKLRTKVDDIKVASADLNMSNRSKLRRQLASFAATGTKRRTRRSMDCIRRTVDPLGGSSQRPDFHIDPAAGRSSQLIKVWPRPDLSESIVEWHLFRQRRGVQTRVAANGGNDGRVSSARADNRTRADGHLSSRAPPRTLQNALKRNKKEAANWPAAGPGVMRRMHPPASTPLQLVTRLQA